MFSVLGGFDFFAVCVEGGLSRYDISRYNMFGGAFFCKNALAFFVVPFLADSDVC